MTDLNKLFNSLFLAEREIRKLMELLYFSYRDFTTGPDEILREIHFGRAHHRIIYFINKQKEISIKDLLIILRISKQSLSRVLNQLVLRKYVKMESGFDKRSKKLSLTQKGIELEKKLSSVQIKKIRKIISKVEENDINGFKKILYAMIDPEGKKIFNKLN